MCGICGEWRFDGPVRDAALEAMLPTLAQAWSTNPATGLQVQKTRTGRSHISMGGVYMTCLLRLTEANITGKS